jgi:hypothetical protein
MSYFLMTETIRKVTFTVIFSFSSKTFAQCFSKIQNVSLHLHLISGTSQTHILIFSLIQLCHAMNSLSDFNETQPNFEGWRKSLAYSFFMVCRVEEAFVLFFIHCKDSSLARLKSNDADCSVF